MMVTPNYPPQRVLDLGCGVRRAHILPWGPSERIVQVGMWTIDAARRWPDATFVGFDIVNVQFPLKHVEPHVARRISWEHGNL